MFEAYVSARDEYRAHDFLEIGNDDSWSRFDRALVAVHEYLQRDPPVDIGEAARRSLAARIESAERALADERKAVAALVEAVRIEHDTALNTDDPDRISVDAGNALRVEAALATYEGAPVGGGRDEAQMGAVGLQGGGMAMTAGSVLAPIIGADPVLTVSWLYSGIVVALILCAIAFEGWRRR